MRIEQQDNDGMIVATGKTFPIEAAHQFAGDAGCENEVKAIRESRIEWDGMSRARPHRVKAGRIIHLFEQLGVMERFLKERWPQGNNSKSLWYKEIAHEYDDRSGTEIPDSIIEQDEQDSFEFALEAHLRDFIAKHLTKIEAGLVLVENGIEYRIDGGRIDILAKDSAGKYVVIELKLSQGRSKTLGQILHYMGWVNQNLGNGPCRGIIIGSEITDDLKIAVSAVANVKLAKYIMNFDIELTN